MRALGKLLRPLPRRLLLGLALLVLGVLRWFDVNPLVLRPAEPLAQGTPVRQQQAGDVLLVVDPQRVQQAARAGTFADADWSYGWINLLAQEFGPAALLPPTELDEAALDQRRVVVISRSAQAAAVAQLAALQRFVEGGGTLLVEQPEARWRPLTGAVVLPTSGRGGERLAGPLAGPAVQAGWPELAKLPYVTRAAPLDCATTAGANTTTTLLSADGAPVACRTARGAGVVLALGLDVGRLLTALQQGTPGGAGFTVTADRYPDKLSPHLETSDLVADEALLDNPIPYADLAEGLIAGLLDDAGPLPRLWGHPGAAPGSYLMTHDEEGMGSPAAWMAEAEQAWGVRSTYFVMLPAEGDGPSAEAVATMRRSAAMGLHWYRGDNPDDGMLELLGAGPLRPVARMRSLEQQAGWFAARFGGAPRLNRNHYLLWEQDWALPFRKLAAAGISLDSTYGPDVTCRGYLFGTGRPFAALDEQGLPLPIWELPFQSAEDLGGADQAYLERLLRDSAERYHTAVVPLFHPNAFAWRPKPELYQSWKESFVAARRLGLWIGDLAAYQTFEQARRAGQLRSSWQAARGLLQVEVRASGPGHALAVAARWRGRPLTVARLDQVEVQPVRQAVPGGTLALVPLPPGGGRLELQYAQPGQD